MAEDQKLASASGALQNLFGTGDENVRLLEKLMDVMALAGQLEQRADYDTIVTTQFAETAIETVTMPAK